MKTSRSREGEGEEVVITKEWLAAEGEKMKLEIRANCMHQVDALLLADWRFELPALNDSEPWQWYWRRPPRRKGSKGRFFWSTNQAYNALKKEDR